MHGRRNDTRVKSYLAVRSHEPGTHFLDATRLALSFSRAHANRRRSLTSLAARAAWYPRYPTRRRATHECAARGASARPRRPFLRCVGHPPLARVACPRARVHARQDEVQRGYGRTVTGSIARCVTTRACLASHRTPAELSRAIAVVARRHLARETLPSTASTRAD